MQFDYVNFRCFILAQTDVSLLKPLATLRPNGPQATVHNVAGLGGTHYIHPGGFFSETDFSNKSQSVEEEDRLVECHLTYQRLGIKFLCPQLKLRSSGQLVQCLRLLILGRSCLKHSLMSSEASERLQKKLRKNSRSEAASSEPGQWFGFEICNINLGCCRFGFEIRKINLGCCRYPIYWFSI